MSKELTDQQQLFIELVQEHFSPTAPGEVLFMDTATFCNMVMQHTLVPYNEAEVRQLLLGLGFNEEFIPENRNFVWQVYIKE